MAKESSTDILQCNDCTRTNKVENFEVELSCSSPRRGGFPQLNSFFVSAIDNCSSYSLSCQCLKHMLMLMLFGGYMNTSKVLFVEILRLNLHLLWLSCWINEPRKKTHSRIVGLLKRTLNWFFCVFGLGKFTYTRWAFYVTDKSKLIPGRDNLMQNHKYAFLLFKNS